MTRKELVDERYVLTKEAKLWAAETHEYVYLVSLPQLTAENLDAYFKAVVADGLSRIHPGSEHMRSDITVLFLADQIQPEAEKG